jgi:hypothetical protein
MHAIAAIILMVMPFRDAPVAADCTCARAVREHGWCDACSVGFVASFRVGSPELYETIHPHGHEVDPEVVRCASCRRAIKENGWCDDCGAGYHSGEAYFSQLTYLLVQGEVVARPEALACAECRRHAQQHGWCVACSAGMVGNVRFAERSLFDRAARQLDIFFVARETVARCVFCAQAMIANGRCPECRVTYADGKPSTPAPTGKRSD